MRRYYRTPQERTMEVVTWMRMRMRTTTRITRRAVGLSAVLLVPLITIIALNLVPESLTLLCSLRRS